LSVAEIEKDLGMEVFSTSSEGIRGVLRRRYEDFRVKEIPIEASEERRVNRGGKYTIFWMEKQGLDTLLAVKRIAKSLGVSQKRFSFAGMKDKNAITLQRVSAFKVSPDLLEQIKLKGIHIEVIAQSDEAVHMGSHLGNSFSIVVREIPLAKGEVERRVQDVSREIGSMGGVPNYFGHQRFGLTRPITHEVGLKMLAGDFKSAAMVFLSKTSPFESKEAIEAREELSTSGNFRLALKRFPSKLSYELAMLNKLASDPSNFANAFRALPIRLLRMFVSAAQSWLFNKFISMRLKENIPANQCVQGDLVVAIDKEGLTTGQPATVDELNIGALNSELSIGKATVVYPVPGFDMKLPQGTMYRIVRGIMGDEGLMPRSFWIGMMPELSSPGVLRPILLIPKNLKTTTSSSDTKSSSIARFEFSLVRGAYATVVLREFMKNDDPFKAGY
jgi:tRNA pseudouridine13 synthase